MNFFKKILSYFTMTDEAEKIEAARKSDQKGHYSIDGVSFDGQNIYIAGDGTKKR
ncbi:MAG: hypothetical protein M9962_09255 [Oligoflexia bacterium]|nr:hypothetical protein [Oligoflexia bacterium]